MSTLFRAMFGYCFLVLTVRIVGRRPGKQMTPFEFVLIFFIGGLVLTPTIGDDRSLTNAFCVIMTIGLIHFTFAWLKQKSPVFGRLLDGTPLVLLENQTWQLETMKNMGVNDDDVMAAARDKGLRTLDDIKYAFLERNGEISIIPRSGGS